jgi:hypothetical protein
MCEVKAIASRQPSFGKDHQKSPLRSAAGFFVDRSLAGMPGFQVINRPLVR